MPIQDWNYMRQLARARFTNITKYSDFILFKMIVRFRRKQIGMKPVQTGPLSLIDPTKGPR